MRTWLHLTLSRDYLTIRALLVRFLRRHGIVLMSMKYRLFLSFFVLCFGAGCRSDSATSALPDAGSQASTTLVIASTSTLPTVATSSSAEAVVTPTTTKPADVNAPPPTTKPAPVPPASPSPDPDKPKPSTHYVSMTEDAFSPKVLVIQAGDTVVWVNRSHSSHTVVANETVLLWDSGNLLPNKSYKRIFPYPGTYNYNCSLHAGMKATIVVR